MLRSRFPEKTPLNAKVTGTVDRDAYTIEKVIFESRPRFYVTANLYLPKGAKVRDRAWSVRAATRLTARAEPAYQSFAQGLARMGYVVLIFDPIGQGERLQYGHVEKPERPGVGVGEHLLAGNQQFLVGEFFGSVAGMGRHPRARLSALAAGGRSEARRHHRQLAAAAR